VNTNKTGGAAFPVSDTYHPNGQVEYGSVGMTLRDYFATAVMQGIVSGSTHGTGEMARRAYEVADAMLAEREKNHE
jgi:hypothetical protein